MKFPLRLAYLAATCYNVFEDVFSPAAKPESTDSFRLFPAMMMFRHAVELILKAIIRDVLKAHPPTNTHKVSDIFEQHVRGNLQGTLGDDEQFVSDALRELQDADPGDAFRFGFDKNGLPYFQNMPESVDARKVFDVCERLWGALWRVHGPV